MKIDRRFELALLIFGAAVCGGVIGGSVGFLAAPALREPLSSALTTAMNRGTGISGAFVTPPPVVNQSGLVEDEQSVSVVRNVQPAVVSILISKKIPQPRQVPMVDPFFGFPDSLGRSSASTDEDMQIGGGSGFFVSSDGLVVTNKHVVEDRDAEYTVVTPDGKKLPATVLARDSVLDLAILRVEGAGYPFLTFGSSDDLKVGQTVLAIGNALDEFRNTVTKGIVSGLNRRLTASGAESDVLLEEAIQTDAAINPGNSGGPLIDLHGRVVGMNTAVSVSGQLIGFALPSSVIQRDVEQVKKTGKITRSFLGIRYLLIDEDLVKKNQLSVDHGVLISRGETRADLAVVPGSPADTAGLRENDIVLAVNGLSIDDEHGLSSIIGRYSPGDTVTLRVYRQGVESDVEVTLGEYKETTK